MAWIKTVPFEEADEKLQKILLEMSVSFPTEYTIELCILNKINVAGTNLTCGKGCPIFGR